MTEREYCPISQVNYDRRKRRRSREKVANRIRVHRQSGRLRCAHLHAFHFIHFQSKKNLAMRAENETLGARKNFRVKRVIDENAATIFHPEMKRAKWNCLQQCANLVCRHEVIICAWYAHQQGFAP
ncbi:MAG TPA: hypothetical protein VEO95_10390 [Chthoniobacteraceae bacterium]|nr:hypothetical protein [Chthoniobacteraceae bacterium]